MMVQLDRTQVPVTARATAPAARALRCRTPSAAPAPARPRPNPAVHRRVHTDRRPASGVVAQRPMVPAARRTRCQQTHADPGFRLGRWPRLTITVCVLVVGLLFATGALPTGSPPAAGTQSVTVHAGDTLWSIAHTAAPGEDVRATVERIREFNGLTQLAALPVGMVLIVPAG